MSTATYQTCTAPLPSWWAQLEDDARTCQPGRTEGHPVKGRAGRPVRKCKSDWIERTSRLPGQNHRRLP